tara:strand:+ start:671 stop:1030 length:360 start_codon:yes stop_codon:yes gene_type:complete
MKSLLVIIFLIICTTLILVSSSSAQNHDGVIGQEANIFPRMFQKNMMCSEGTFVRQDLKERLQTIKVWWGLDKNENLSELFVNQNTGRWLFMLSFTDGITCGLIGGEMSVPYNKNPYFK